MRVRVEPVLDAEPRVGDVREDVLRQERRGEQEEDMQEHDGTQPDAHGQRARQQQDGDVEAQHQPQSCVEERSGKPPGGTA